MSVAVAPGEPVPPGFENEVKEVSKLQTAIDRITTKALVGLEYVIELTQPSKSTANAYYCALCDKRGDPNSIFIHLLSQAHRLKWLEKHFPTVLRELAPLRFNNRSKAYFPRLCTYICEQIEDSLGRLAPSVVEANEFARSRVRIINAIINDRHLDESVGSSFVHLIDQRVILNAIDRKLHC